MSFFRDSLLNLRGAARPAPRRVENVERYEDQQRFRADVESFGANEPQTLEALVPGEQHETPYGVSYMVRTAYAHDHVHGEAELRGWLSQSLAGAAAFTQDRRLAGIDPRRCLFLDTETTGLNAGSGTLVFLTGVGMFTEDGFEVRQYFLRDPGEERAMLHALHELMTSYDALVTFNGRSFDMPMLSARFTVNRQPLRADRWPNLDLLHPARRLWKRRLESCRLASLEDSILGVRRTGQDVPGFLIPQLYYEYLQNGDARQMRRVIYHNLFDVLSMVTLATVLCDTFARVDTPALPHDDLISLARWYEALDMLPQPEIMIRAPLDPPP